MPHDFISYDLARALHIIAVIGWMAGLLMLPRLYVYQTESAPGGELDKKMIEAAARLRAIIVTPAMILVWVLGLYLLGTFFIGEGAQSLPVWLIVKLAIVTALTGWHGYLVSAGKKLAQGQRARSAKFWRLTNEVPFVAAIVIVLLATLEPRFS
ncbi:MAG: CopD family protein [Hyphomonadaceae bacterium]|nr:CopD family protein [Hyphomonadaceae bacterium]